MKNRLDRRLDNSHAQRVWKPAIQQTRRFALHTDGRFWLRVAAVGLGEIKVFLRVS